jgi:hypothetical protein
MPSLCTSRFLALLAFLALLLPASRAEAARKTVSATVRIGYTISEGDSGQLAGRYYARGVKVAAYSRTILGIPIIDDTATTGSDGRAKLRFRVKKGRNVRFRMSTECSVARTWPGKWNVFHSVHDKTYKLSADNSYCAQIDRTWFFDGVFNRALMVHDVGVRTAYMARDLFAGQVSFDRMDYSFPAWMGEVSFAPFAWRAAIQDAKGDRHPETVMHETGHTYWYVARGVAEYHAPFRHDLDERTGNRELALSEGFANWFAIWAGEQFARAHGKPELADASYKTCGGEKHKLWEVPESTWRAWSDDNETNIMCALWDLVDATEDGAGVAPGCRDRVNGAPYPVGRAGMRAVYQAVKDTRGEERMTLKTFWSKGLQRIYGADGAEALELNGVKVS